MSRKKIVAGNWKMNANLSEATSLVEQVTKSASDSNVIKIFFPPLPFLHIVQNLLPTNKFFFTGAQNCSEHSKGAYTGEVSATMIKSCGASYVIIGHSERRAYFNETDAQLVAKINQCLANNLTPVFCFGEQLSDRKNQNHFETVKRQLFGVLTSFDKSSFSNFILAYEPVWAIGTGETATPQQAQEMHQFVRSCLNELYDEEAAQSTSILYGGSCNAQNAKELFACPDVDGGLIGGASLKSDDFCKIIASF